MQRSIDPPLVWLLHREFRNVIQVFARVRWQALLVKTYCVGSPVLEEPLSGLPDLSRHSQCKIIKSEKKVRILRMPLRIGQTIRPVYVKQHNALFSHRLASLFCPSAALRSLRGTAIFLRDGFATARPVAAVEYRRWGVLIKSFYVTEEIKGAKPVADYWRENLLRLRGSEGRVRRRAVLKKLASSFKSLHEKKIYHNDLKAANILARQERSAAEVTLSFIDLQGVKRCFYVSKRRRVKNLAQINRSLGCYLSRTEKLTFLRAYVGHAGCDRYKWRPLVRGVIKETNRQMLREKSRHPGTETLPPPQILVAQAGPGKKIGRRWIGGGEHGCTAL